MDVDFSPFKQDVTEKKIGIEKEIKIEALSIIANAVLINMETYSEPLLTEVGNTVIKLIPLFQDDIKQKGNEKVRYIFQRLLFLITFKKNIVKVEDNMLDKVLQTVEKDVKTIDKEVYTLYSSTVTRTDTSSTFTQLSIIETLKTVFNLCNNYSPQSLTYFEKIGGFWKASAALCEVGEITEKNWDLVRYIFNCLMCEGQIETWFKNGNNGGIEVTRLKIVKKVLEYALFATHPLRAALLDDATFSGCLTCLLKVVQAVYNQRSSSNSENTIDSNETEKLKSLIDSYLVPTPQDRQHVLGSTSVLPSQHSLCHSFIRFSTQVSSLSLRTCITLSQEIYFTICDQNEEKMISMVGLGYTSGFLANRREAEAMREGEVNKGNGNEKKKKSKKIEENVAEEVEQKEIKEELSTINSQRPKEKTDGEAKNINPITGQYLNTNSSLSHPNPSSSSTKIPTIDDWTDEEKEREAEKMFVLFERLNKNGIIKVENPVRKWQQEGRFEEM